VRPCRVLTPVRLHGSTVLVSLRQDEVRAWQEGLLGLAQRLEGDAPVNPCGVARARVTLTDGAGPLYNPDPVRELGATVWWVADGLRLSCPHRWGCPVIAKLDPDHVAWTCERCGRVATSVDFFAQPR
jgi:hypothetical protein